MGLILILGILALEETGKLVLKMLSKQRRVDINAVKDYLFQNCEELQKNELKILSYDELSLYVARTNNHIVSLITDGKRKGFKAAITYIAGLFNNLEAGKISLKDIQRELSHKVFLKRTPKRDILCKLMKDLIKRSTPKVLKRGVKSTRISLSEKIKPFNVVSFEDGVKRSLVACYSGDLLTAYRLAIGALNKKDDSLIRIFAAYLGFQLISLPPNYTAPSFEEIRELIAKAKPRKTLEEILYAYVKSLVESFRSFEEYVKARNYFVTKIDELFQLMNSTEDLSVKDIIAYFLATSEPYFLSRKKADFLIRYVRGRSPVIGSYAWASLARARTIGTIYSGRIPLEDAVGILRELRSRFFTTMNELRIIGDKNRSAEREALIRLAFVTEEFTRSLYWILTLENLRLEGIRDLLEHIILLQLDGLQMLLEKKAPVSIRLLFDIFYTTFLNYRYMETIMKKESLEALEYGLLTMAERLYQIIIDAIDEGRAISDIALKIASLAWMISYLSMKTRRKSPVLPSLLELVAKTNGKRLKEISRESLDSYLVYLGSVGMALLESLFDSKLESEKVSRLINYVLEVADYIILRGLYSPLFMISILDTIQRALSSFKINEKSKTHLILLKKSLSNEELNILEEALLEKVLPNAG